MSKVMLVATLAKQIPYDCTMDYIGVDRGAWCCYQQNIPMKWAIGDFDSISKEQLQAISSVCEIIQLPTRKNETDSEYAIAFAKSKGYEEIILFGGLGGRIDHEIANLYLLMQRKESITLMNEHNALKMLTPGKYCISKQFQYLSFFALEESCITLKGVEYPLHQHILYPKDIYAVSNEIVGVEAIVEIHSGCVLCVQSEDEKKL